MCTVLKNIILNFTPPALTPALGYKVKWRVVGTTVWNNIPNQFSSPIIITGVPACNDIEGTIEAQCDSNVYSNPVSWVVNGNGLCFSYILNDTATYTYTSCTTGNSVTVSNNSSTPTTVCAIENSVSGGGFTKTTSCP